MNILREVKKKLIFLVKYLYYEIRSVIYKNNINIDYYSGLNNFGDVLNKFLIEELTRKRVFEVRSQIYKRIHYLVIGSILQRATNYSIVWGAGFIAKDSICCQNPKKIYAVRGPLTRKILLEQDIYCPEIYGDPALLMPLIYNPKDIHKKYNLGIIPHYIDKNNEWLKSFNLSSKVKIIDIQNNDSKAFIDSVLECKKIASSSLHGIIIADSYYIPSLWIEFSDKVYGDGFKFYDYFLSVKKDIKSPYKVNLNSSIIDIEKQFINSKIDIDLEPLIQSCPFKLKLLKKS